MVPKSELSLKEIDRDREREREKEGDTEPSAVYGRGEHCQMESWSSGKVLQCLSKERRRDVTGAVQQRHCSYAQQLRATMLPCRIIVVCLFCCCIRRGEARHQAQRKCGCLLDKTVEDV